MRQLQLFAHGEPSDVIQLNTVAEAAIGQEIRSNSSRKRSSIR